MLQNFLLTYGRHNSYELICLKFEINIINFTQDLYIIKRKICYFENYRYKVRNNMI